jgi:uncharacterized membrane protein
MNRLDKTTILALWSLLYSLMHSFGLIQIPGELVDNLVTALVNLFVFLGIINNSAEPAKKEGESDK